MITIEDLKTTSVVTVYTQDNCSYCVKAKDLLKTEGYTTVEYNINNAEHKTALLENCHAIGFTPKTVPQIWINDTHIGGYTELAKWIEERR